MNIRVGLAAGALSSAAAVAQPALSIRFDNGTNSTSTAPGASVPVSIYAANMPALGDLFCFDCGGVGIPFPAAYAGFLSVTMNLNGVTSGGASWSGLTTPPPFVGPPFGSPGTASGASVLGIISGIAFGAPVTGTEILLWQGTLTVGSADVSLATAIQPVGAPPRTGFEFALDIGLPFLVSDIFAAGNGSAVVHVPSPSTAAVMAAVGVMVTRRKRERSGQ
jgi:hypothetical protein